LADTDLADLVVSARSGDGPAFGEIFRRLSPAVAAFLASRGAREPQDLTSEVFLGVFQKMDSFVGGAPELRTFVFSVAHRRLVDDLRQQARRPATYPHDEALDARTTGSAEDAALDHVADEQVRALLGTLSPEQQTVLELRVVAELTAAQVAQVLGKSPGAVKQTQRRALAALRAMITKDGVPT